MSNTKYEITAEYVDTCLPCYLQDGHNRKGEWLLCEAPYGQTEDEFVDALIEQMNGESPPEDFEESFPEWPKNEIRAALKEAVAGVDLRFIDNDGHEVDKGDMTDEHVYEDDHPYVYVVLRWEVDDNV